MSEIPFKLNYMGKLFKKISHKPTESYVIQRLWHRLDDERVKFVLQQHVTRDNDKRALIDLYLPQFNIAIEVNEPYHLNEEQKQHDSVRNSDIEHKANCKVVIIDCSQSLSDIHKQIDSIITLIKNRIAELGNDFKPWTGDDEMKADYYKDKEYLDVQDNNYIRTIDDICTIFNVIAIHRGFLRAGAADITKNEDYIIWFPSIYSKEWNNQLSNDGSCIIEENKGANKDEHIQNALKAANEEKIKKRITFFRKKDDLGFNFYKFVGVFEFDAEETIKRDAVYWKRIETRIKIKDFKTE